MLSVKPPRSRLSLGARRGSAPGGGGPPAARRSSGEAALSGDNCSSAAEEEAGNRRPSKLSRRFWKSRPGGEGAGPGGEGAGPGGEGAGPGGEGAGPGGEGAGPGGEGAGPGGEGAGPGRPGGEEEEREGPGPGPYYLRAFLAVLRAVLGGEDEELFNEEDQRWLRTFQKLSAVGQMLYVRLFQRKLNWLKVMKLNYDEIAPDLTSAIEELRLAGLLQTGSELCDISEALNLLSAPELKLLAKSFHLRTQGRKTQILKSLLHLAKQQSIFSCTQKPSGPGLAIFNRVKEMVGPCVRVAVPARAVFARVLLLFNLTELTDEEEMASAGQSQLSTVILVNMGHVKFPSYTVLRERKIFQHRADLLRYAEAVHSQAEVVTAMANGNWSDALQISKAARDRWMHLEDSSDVGFYQELPVFLRRFTAGWIYTRIRSYGVEILQRLHMYEEAVEELQSLLEQSIYCPESRGHWWNRLSLNLHQHLKQIDETICCLLKGLDDVWVHTGHRLALYQRALRIRDSPSCKKWKHLLQDMPVMRVEDVSHVTVKGRTCPGMGNALFLVENCSEEPNLGQGEPSSTVICSVEEVSLAHYKQQGFDQGIHGEGTTFLTLFGLLFWDIIFLPGIPDVFRNPYQACPLDLYTKCFYQHRKMPIELRLQFLQETSIETLHKLIADVWNDHQGTMTTLINWELFSCLQQAQSLVSCLGGLFLSGICSILVKDLRHCRGGLPDLVVWNSHSLQYKLAEVKGPSDQLSHKQMVWLDQLQRLGADVEVCHVSAVGAQSHKLS